MLAQGADLEEAIAHTASRESNTALEVDMDRVMQAFMLMYDTSLEPVEARIRIGAEDGPDRVGQRIDCEPLPGDGGRLAERQAAQGLL
jgi:hypothetical protein